MNNITSYKTERSPGDKSQPLYRQVVAVLRADIEAGVYPVGAQLPTEGALCERFGISRHTVREALRELRAQGLVMSRRGSGTTVLTPQENGHVYVHEAGSINDLSQYALGHWNISDSRIVALDHEQAALVSDEPGARWLRIVAARYKDDQAKPEFWTELLLHADYARVATLIGKEARPVYELVQDIYGVQVDEVTQTLRAVEARDEVARTLRLKKRSTVMEVARVYRLAGGRVIEASSNFYPPAQFQFEIRLRRAAP